MATRSAAQGRPTWRKATEKGARIDLLEGHHAHQDESHGQIDQAAEGQGADDAEGDVSFRVAGFFSRDRDDIEAQVGEKYQSCGLDDAPRAIGDQGQPLGGPDETHAHGQDKEDDRQLDENDAPGHQGVETGAEDQENGKKDHNNGSGQIDDPPGLGERGTAGPDGQGQPVGLEQILKVKRPA
jgi:hypothetical protein